MGNIVMILYIDFTYKKTVTEDIAVYIQPDRYILFGTLKEATEFAKQLIALGIVQTYLIIGS